jgi:hypothetical protein
VRQASEAAVRSASHRFSTFQVARSNSNGIAGIAATRRQPFAAFFFFWRGCMNGATDPVDPLSAVWQNLPRDNCLTVRWLQRSNRRFRKATQGFVCGHFLSIVASLTCAQKQSGALSHKGRAFL